MASSPDDRVIAVDRLALAEWTKSAIGQIGGKNKLARALNVSTHTVLRYERGDADRIQENQIKAIASFDKKSVEEILDSLAIQEDLRENGKALSNSELTTSFRKLENKVNGLSETFGAFLTEMGAITEQITYLAEELKRLKDGKSVRGSEAKHIKDASSE